MMMSRVIAFYDFLHKQKIRLQKLTHIVKMKMGFRLMRGMDLRAPEDRQEGALDAI